MKKDRNCGGNYPIYGAMPYGNIPYGGMPMPLPINNAMPVMTNYSGTESQINNLSNEINALEQRVSSLESLVNKNMYSQGTYNTSNYQMM